MNFRKWVELIGRSQKLLEDTIAGASDEVVKAIEAVRASQYAPTFYNNEQALRYVIKFAYVAAVEQYLKIEELPSGHGIADVVFLPKQASRYPAMVVELKWNKSPKEIHHYAVWSLLLASGYDEESRHAVEKENLRARRLFF